jgi:hypothetical protein
MTARKKKHAVAGSTFHAHPSGAVVEVGTISHEGKAFSNVGSVLDLSAGHLTGYVTKNKTTGAYELTTWDGSKVLCPLKLVSTHRGGFGRSTIYSWRGTCGGKTFSGRNGGEQMLLHMRARKK